MKFTDYEPKDLIGKTVLITSGSRNQESRSIRIISSITKSAFKVKNYKGEEHPTNYRFKDGGAVGHDPSSRMNWGTVHIAELITEERTTFLKAEWAEAKKVLSLRAELEVELKKDISSITLTTILNLLRSN